MKGSILSIAISLIVIMSSCAPSYVANSIHAPLFSNKGELQLRVNGGSSGFNPQVSYAITEHWGAMLNGSFSANEDDLGNKTQANNLVEIGAGYYTNVNGRFVYEIFAGIGGGNAFGKIDDINGTPQPVLSDFTRVFIQPSIGWVGEAMDASISARFVSLDMRPTIETNGITSSGFFEPAIGVGAGFRYVKLHVQFGISAPFTPESQLAFDFVPILINIGATARIGRKYY